MSKVKIFVVYHKPYHIYKNEVFEPIQTGADFSGVDLGFLKDNTVDNIAHKNPNYGEMTAWYWVWMNWLPNHPEAEYIGFCHYRRFLDFSRPANNFHTPHGMCTYDEFIKKFSAITYSEDFISKSIDQSDIILPGKFICMTFANNFAGNVYDQYAAAHPVEDMGKALALYLSKHPEMKDAAHNLFNGSWFYSGLNFVMRRDLFCDWVAWIYDLMSQLEAQCNWASYNTYGSIRAPAYIAERFLSLWVLEKQAKNKNLRIREFYRWTLAESVKRFDVPLILSGVKQWLRWKLGLRKHFPLPPALNNANKFNIS